ncbi:hypothetical protein ABPG74_013323 [Tetrahymena malaccensis]
MLKEKQLSILLLYFVYQLTDIFSQHIKVFLFVPLLLILICRDILSLLRNFFFLLFLQFEVRNLITTPHKVFFDSRQNQPKEWFSQSLNRHNLDRQGSPSGWWVLVSPFNIWRERERVGFVYAQVSNWDFAQLNKKISFFFHFLYHFYYTYYFLIINKKQQIKNNININIILIQSDFFILRSYPCKKKNRWSIKIFIVQTFSPIIHLINLNFFEFQIVLNVYFTAKIFILLLQIVQFKQLITFRFILQNGYSNIQILSAVFITVKYFVESIFTFQNSNKFFQNLNYVHVTYFYKVSKLKHTQKYQQFL